MIDIHELSKRWCPKCEDFKFEEEFYKNKSNKSGLTSWCQECLKSVNKGKRDERKHLGVEVNHSREKIKALRLKTVYGVSYEFFDELYKKQKGCCAICGKHQSMLNCNLGLDHNHTTGQIRGLLCGNCNLGIGHFFEKRELFFKSVEYLDDYEKLSNLESSV